MNATVGKSHMLSDISTDMREIMTGLGYLQVMPFTLTSDRVHFDWMCREKTDDVTYVMHPISERPDNGQDNYPAEISLRYFP